MKAIVTKYHGPGNVRGARISAHAEGLPRRFYSYNYAARDAHVEAVKAFCQEMEWHGELVEGHLPDGTTRVWVWSRNLAGNGKLVDQFSVCV